MHRTERRWLIAALAIASLYSALALRMAFRAPNLIQDDARQHVFWMARFRDPALFPGDPIADYFQAVAPVGYKAVYWIFAQLGLDPIVLARLLPAALALLAAYFAFRLCRQLLPDPRGAFFASVLLSQLIWLNDDVISATPRAFVYPLFLAFWSFLLERRRIASLCALGLQCLFYPQVALVSAGVLVLQLLKWEEGRLQFARDRIGYVFVGVALVAALLLPFSSALAIYKPVIAQATAASLPEFLPGGRSEFFIGGFAYWLSGERSGLLPSAVPWHFVLLGLLGPLAALVAGKGRYLAPLIYVALAAVILWAAAHVSLFNLHLPARYSQWVFLILIACAGGMTLSLFWAPGLRRVLLLSLVGGLLAYPHLRENFPQKKYLEPPPQGLLDFLRAQPKDTLIATLDKVGDSIPALAQRSVFVSAEHAIPYHQGYYRPLRQRGQELLRAFYSSDPQELREFIEQNGIDLFILARGSAGEELRWFKDIAPLAEEAGRTGQTSPTGQTLSDSIERATVWEDAAFVVLDARRIAPRP